jgi:DNA-binding NarL/FixJ family response regulator
VPVTDQRCPANVHSSTKLLFPSGRRKARIRFQAILNSNGAGASGFLLKDVRPEQLADAVRVVAAGDTLLAPTITRRLVEQYLHRPRPGAGIATALNSLTDRELDVLRLVARGQSNQQIADTLFLGESTVKTHLTHLFAKLDLRDRAQAVVLAYETGLIQPGDH